MPADPDDGYDRDAVLAVYDGMAAGYTVRFGAEVREPSPETRFLDDALTGLPPWPDCRPGRSWMPAAGRARTAVTWLTADAPRSASTSPRLARRRGRARPRAALIAAGLTACRCARPTARQRPPPIAFRPPAPAFGLSRVSAMITRRFARYAR